MKLSKRLTSAYNMVDKGSIICDVGCDHGYLSIKLILDNIADFAYMTDINEGPLNQALNNVKEFHILDKVSVILTDGLKNVEKKYDTVIILGMGGLLIKNILESTKIKDNVKLILGPNKDQDILRDYLYQNGYISILDDFVLDNNKPYFIMKMVKGKNEELNRVEKIFGKNNLTKENIDFKNYLANKISFFENKSTLVKNEAAKKDLLEELDIYKEAYNEYCKCN